MRVCTTTAAMALVSTTSSPISCHHHTHHSNSTITPSMMLCTPSGFHKAATLSSSEYLCLSCCSLRNRILLCGLTSTLSSCSTWQESSKQRHPIGLSSSFSSLPRGPRLGVWNHSGLAQRGVDQLNCRCYRGDSKLGLGWKNSLRSRGRCSNLKCRVSMIEVAMLEPAVRLVLADMDAENLQNLIVGASVVAATSASLYYGLKVNASGAHFLGVQWPCGNERKSERAVRVLPAGGYFVDIQNLIISATFSIASFSYWCCLRYNLEHHLNTVKLNSWHEYSVY